MLSVLCREDPVECANRRVITIYEYERYIPLKGWAGDHLCTTDPGKWSNGDLSRYAEQFKDLEEDPDALVEQGYFTLVNWAIMPTAVSASQSRLFACVLYVSQLSLNPKDGPTPKILTE